MLDKCHTAPSIIENPFYSPDFNNKFDNLHMYNIPGDNNLSTSRNNNVLDNATKTGSVDNIMHDNSVAQQPRPTKQQSSDSYTDESQLNTFDKSEDDILFSDSIAISAFNTTKANIWQNADVHGIITWQTDTSPSDNLENEDNYSNFCSFSLDATPSEENDHSFHTSSSIPLFETTNDPIHEFLTDAHAHAHAPSNKFLEMHKTGSMDSNDAHERAGSKVITFDHFLQRAQCTSSCDSSPTVPSPGASG